jgi:uncharacterized protein YqjF (DUF2071 family)
VQDANGILNVQHYRYSGARLGVEFAYLTDMLKYVAAEVLLDQQQDHVTLRSKRKSKKRFAFLNALTTCIVDDGAACRTRFAGRMHHGFSLLVLDESHYQFKVHGQFPLAILCFVR